MPRQAGGIAGPAMLGLTSVSQHLKIKQACGVKIIVILITVFVVVKK